MNEQDITQSARDAADRVAALQQHLANPYRNSTELRRFTIEAKAEDRHALTRVLMSAAANGCLDAFSFTPFTATLPHDRFTKVDLLMVTLEVEAEENPVEVPNV